MKLTELKKSTVHRVCIFGPPKSGKTQLVGKLAEHFNLLWFDFEDGYKPLLKLPIEWQERIEIIKIPDTKIFPIGIETILKVIKGDKQFICVAHGKCSCPLCKQANAPVQEVELNALDNSWIVVFDSGTQIAQSAMNKIILDKNETYKPQWDDYAAQGHLMYKLLSQMQQAPYNLIFITHEEETELEDGSKRITPVSGSAKFSKNTAKFFDDVIYSRVANRKHTFGSATTYLANVITGSRTDLRIEDSPDAPDLMQIFKSDNEETKNAIERLKALKKEPK
jgi:hypothetical protein